VRWYQRYVAEAIRESNLPPQQKAGVNVADWGPMDRADAVIESLPMRIRIYSNGIEAPLSPFIGKFLGNVCLGVASSLKTPLPIKTLKYELEGEIVHIEVNQMRVPLNMSRGFSRIIVLDTLRGMIRHLKLADPNGAIRIELETET
jgi:hypothetical protein